MSNGVKGRVVGCVNGVLADPRAYFFSLIDRTEGSPAPDWKTVLESLPARGMGINPKPGEIQPPNAPHYGITVMIDASQNARGRIWLPSDVPAVQDGIAWYTHEIQVIADGPAPGSMVWAWIDKGGAPYAPRPCEQAVGGGAAATPAGPAGGGGQAGGTVIDLGPVLKPLSARIQALEQLVSAQAKEIAELKARPAAAPAAAPTALPKRVAFKTDHGTYVTAESDGRMSHREQRPAAWQTLKLEVID
jgi:hypothetical protein